MVYSEVIVIYGFPVSRKQLQSHIVNTECQLDAHYSADTKVTISKIEFIEETLGLLVQNFELFPYQCCSDLADVYWIVGKRITAISRNVYDCGMCHQMNNACNQCIDSLENNVTLDVEHILHNITPITSYEVENMNLTMFEPQVAQLRSNLELLRISWNVSDFESQFFLMLDDCLSCS